MGILKTAGLFNFFIKLVVQKQFSFFHQSSNDSNGYFSFNTPMSGRNRSVPVFRGYRSVGHSSEQPSKINFYRTKPLTLLNSFYSLFFCVVTKKGDTKKQSKVKGLK